MPPIPPTSCEEPWLTCYEQLAPRLLIFARQWLHSATDAEDAVQAGFVRFWRSQRDAQPEHYPLLFAAVRTAALDLIRAASRRARREADYGEEESAECFFDVGIEQRETAAQLQSALLRLPAEQREVVVLRIWGELTFAQIAATLGQSTNTVAARHRYAIEALRRILKPHEYERLGV